MTMAQNDHGDEPEAPDEAAIWKSLNSLFAGFEAGHAKESRASLAEMADTDFIRTLQSGLAVGDPDQAMAGMERLEMAAEAAITAWRRGGGAATTVEDVVDGEMHFLFLRRSFIGQHVREAFVRFEGNPYCADKTRTVMRALDRRLIHGTPIVFDRDSEYTYHLPKAILAGEDDILGFFRALRMLDHGFIDSYIKALGTMVERTMAARAGNDAATPDQAPGADPA